MQCFTLTSDGLLDIVTSKSPVCTLEGKGEVLQYSRQNLPWLAKLPQDAKVPDFSMEGLLNAGDHTACLILGSPLLKMGASALLTGHYSHHASLYRPWTRGVCRPSHTLPCRYRAFGRTPLRRRSNTSACLERSKTLSGVAVKTDLLGHLHAVLRKDLSVPAILHQLLWL